MQVIPNREQLPRLNALHIDISALEMLLQKSRTQLASLLEKISQYPLDIPIDWKDMQQLEEIEAKLLEFWEPIEYLYSVAQTEAARSSYQEGLQRITKWHTELGHNTVLYQWMQKIKDNPNFSHLQSVQQKIIQDQLKDFSISGITLISEKKAQYQALQMQLAQDSAQFESNIVDASIENALFVQDSTKLKGLSESIIHTAEQAATEQGRAGWLFTMNGPNFQSIMTSAAHRSLRQAFYTAWITRAAEGSRFDNSQLMYDILSKRHALSQLTGFHNYAERSLASGKMAETPTVVTNFLMQLLKEARPLAKQEFQILEEFANQKEPIGALCEWDIAYFSEQLSQRQFGIQQEQLRAYFPVSHVLMTLFCLLNEQFGLHIEEITLPDLWDPEVKVLEIQDDAQKVRGYLYLDLYTRPNKRPGAWVHPYIQRRLQGQCLQLPLAFVTCNFSPPTGVEPALLTHNDVVTLFHEMGHALHHTVTTVDYAAVSGMAGVPWDAVELPSQLLEQFPWHPTVLKRMSCHYQTGEALPSSIIDALHRSHAFQSGLKLIRQLEFSLFDFQLHQQFDPTLGVGQIQSVLDSVRQKVRIVPTAPFNRFQHSFSHIFSGGYGAGYYSYLWAEVLAADAFDRFLVEGLSKGILSPATGHDFMRSILELGGSVDMLTLFTRFRGRSPHVQALLRQRGLLSASSR